MFGRKVLPVDTRGSASASASASASTFLLLRHDVAELMLHHSRFSNVFSLRVATLLERLLPRQ